jgi:hypothetical protein
MWYSGYDECESAALQQQLPHTSNPSSPWAWQKNKNLYYIKEIQVAAHVQGGNMGGINNVWWKEKTRLVLQGPNVWDGKHNLVLGIKIKH